MRHVFGDHPLFPSKDSDEKVCDKFPGFSGKYGAVLGTEMNDLCILFRRDRFRNVEIIKMDTMKPRLEEQLESRLPSATAEQRNEWEKDVARTCVAVMEWTQFDHPVRVIFATVHAMGGTVCAHYISALKHVCKNLRPDTFLWVCGLDSNIKSGEESELENIMLEDDVHIFSLEEAKDGGLFEMIDTTKTPIPPKGKALKGRRLSRLATVSKQRTIFQTQIRKVGVTDIAHKDFVLGSFFEKENVTHGEDFFGTFYPYLERTVAEEGKLTMLPSPTWPFDHSACFGRVKNVYTKVEGADEVV